MSPKSANKNFFGGFYCSNGMNTMSTAMTLKTLQIGGKLPVEQATAVDPSKDVRS